MKEETQIKSEKKETNSKEEMVEEKKIQPSKEKIQEPKSNEDKIKELEDKVVRSLAEMENQRRRFEKEKDDAYEYGGFVLAKESLSVIDNLDRAKISIINDETFKNNKDLEKILENFEIIQKDLISVFKKNSIEQINCLNKKFDPNLHQAMLEVESESKEPGIVVQEIQKGFTIKGRLLRPSLVGITKSKPKNENKDDNEKNIKKDENSQKNQENE
tara:strand:+ start:652 stop:1299 length:648 start_codon:yes stop_codon:yes gene_type:complete